MPRPDSEPEPNMPDFHSLGLFALACLALTATPGPDMLLIASRSVAQGRSAGFATLAGIQLGTYCHALAVAFGLSELFLLVPAAYDAVRYAGAAYLMFLAWQAFNSHRLRAPSSSEVQRRSTLAVLRQGLFTNLLNPKMALFVIALFPQFVTAEGGSMGVQMLVLASVLNGIGLVVNGAVILLGSQIRSRLGSMRRFPKLPQYILAGVFTGLACRLAFQTRN